MAEAAVGGGFRYQITATNHPTSDEATGLPPGLAVDKATGAITGTPTKAGISAVTLNASDGTGTATASLVITVKAKATTR
jgi:hypothetical protein